MEMEPIYVPSNKLARLCHRVLGFIETFRQEQREEYVQERRAIFNADIDRRNRWRKMFFMRPLPHINDPTMERMLLAEMRASKDPSSHPMFEITSQYGQVHADCKDVLIQCSMTESVAINQNFARAISHMGIDTSELRKQPFGFVPRN